MNLFIRPFLESVEILTEGAKVNKEADQSKKDRIKEAGKELFFRFGFHKTSMSDIARQCGMAKPSLYYYYPKKEAIFEDIVFEEARKFMDGARKKLSDNLPADEKISAFLQIIYQDLGKLAQKTSGLPKIMCDDYPHGKPIVSRIGVVFRDTMRPLLREGQKEDVLRIDDEEITLSAIGLMMKYLTMEWIRQTPGTERDQIVNKTIDIISNGIRRR